MDIIYGIGRIIRIDENCILIIIVDNNNNNRGSPGRMKKCLGEKAISYSWLTRGAESCVIKKKKNPKERVVKKKIVLLNDEIFFTYIYASNPFCFSLKYH